MSTTSSRAASCICFAQLSKLGSMVVLATRDADLVERYPPPDPAHEPRAA